MKLSKYSRHAYASLERYPRASIVVNRAMLAATVRGVSDEK
jgi:hypothetical protein